MTPEETRQVFADLTELWFKKSLPLDIRRRIIGAVDAAARRQGDTLLTSEEMQDMVEGKPWHPDTEQAVILRTREFMFGKTGTDKPLLRPQYAVVVRRIALNALDKEYLAPARREVRKELEAKRANARMN